MSDDETTFSKNLRRCMQNKGWQPADLARHMGVGNPTVSRWLNSERNLSAQDLLALSAVLGVRPETLFGSSFEPPAPRRRPLRWALGLGSRAAGRGPKAPSGPGAPRRSL